MSNSYKAITRQLWLLKQPNWQIHLPYWLRSIIFVPDPRTNPKEQLNWSLRSPRNWLLISRPIFFFYFFFLNLFSYWFLFWSSNTQSYSIIRRHWIEASVLKPLEALLWTRSLMIHSRSWNNNIALHDVYNLDLIAKDARSGFSTRRKRQICLNQMKQQID